MSFEIKKIIKFLKNLPQVFKVYLKKLSKKDRRIVEPGHSISSRHFYRSQKIEIISPLNLLYLVN
jgi:hypothetical protein